MSTNTALVLSSIVEAEIVITSTDVERDALAMLSRLGLEPIAQNASKAKPTALLARYGFDKAVLMLAAHWAFGMSTNSDMASVAREVFDQWSNPQVMSRVKIDSNTQAVVIYGTCCPVNYNPRRPQ